MRARSEEAPSGASRPPVTPDSVKALMIIEAIVIAFFSFWLVNEYVYNVYFRIYVNIIFVEHLTSYTIVLGLGIGLAGTAIAATLYRNLKLAKMKLESVAPRIRGTVDKVLAAIPSVDQQTAIVLVKTPTDSKAAAAPTAAPSGLPVPPAVVRSDEKK